MTRAITPFLMFEGGAEDAMQFYVSLFKDCEITSVDRYGVGEMGPEGSVKRADFRLAGQDFICIDSPIKHEFSFTPAMSIFVDCEDEAELRNAFERSAFEGSVLMPLDDYGFSNLFGWVNDRFGVSWQLNLEA